MSKMYRVTREPIAAQNERLRKRLEALVEVRTKARDRIELLRKELEAGHEEEKDALSPTKVYNTNGFSKSPVNGSGNHAVQQQQLELPSLTSALPTLLQSPLFVKHYLAFFRSHSSSLLFHTSAHLYIHTLQPSPASYALILALYIDNSSLYTTPLSAHVRKQLMEAEAADSDLQCHYLRAAQEEVLEYMSTIELPIFQQSAQWARMISVWSELGGDTTGADNYSIVYGDIYKTDTETYEEPLPTTVENGMNDKQDEDSWLRPTSKRRFQAAIDSPEYDEHKEEIGDQYETEEDVPISDREDVDQLEVEDEEDEYDEEDESLAEDSFSAESVSQESPSEPEEVSPAVSTKSSVNVPEQQRSPEDTHPFVISATALNPKPVNSSPVLPTPSTFSFAPPSSSTSSLITNPPSFLNPKSALPATFSFTSSATSSPFSFTPFATANVAPSSSNPVASTASSLKPAINFSLSKENTQPSVIAIPSSTKEIPVSKTDSVEPPISVPFSTLPSSSSTENSSGGATPANSPFVFAFSAATPSITFAGSTALPLAKASSAPASVSPASVVSSSSSTAVSTVASIPATNSVTAPTSDASGSASAEVSTPITSSNVAESASSTVSVSSAASMSSSFASSPTSSLATSPSVDAIEAIGSSSSSMKGAPDDAGSAIDSSSTVSHGFPSESTMTTSAPVVDATQSSASTKGVSETVSLISSTTPFPVPANTAETSNPSIAPSFPTSFPSASPISFAGLPSLSSTLPSFDTTHAKVEPTSGVGMGPSATVSSDSTPSFGMNNSIASSPFIGNSSTPSPFGSQGTSGFPTGTVTPSFGSSSPFNSTSAMGGFGQSTFGSAPTQPMNSSVTGSGAFGQSQFGGSTLGQSPFSANTGAGAFGQSGLGLQSTFGQGGFGSSTFGQSSFGQNSSGGAALGGGFLAAAQNNAGTFTAALGNKIQGGFAWGNNSSNTNPVDPFAPVTSFGNVPPTSTSTFGATPAFPASMSFGNASNQFGGSSSFPSGFGATSIPQGSIWQARSGDDGLRTKDQSDIMNEQDEMEAMNNASHPPTDLSALSSFSSFGFSTNASVPTFGSTTSNNMAFGSTAQNPSLPSNPGGRTSFTALW